MKMQLQYKTTRLGKFAYHFRKGNPLVVFMSGFGDFDTAQNFFKIISKLPNYYGILAPDYLNSGFSSRSIKSYTLSDEADQIAKLINSSQANFVILVAHSIGGVYAFQMRNEINHLQALVTIEPTTREIVLNPPRDKSYAEHQSIGPDFIQNKIKELFSEDKAKTFWQTTTKNAARFSEKDDQDAENALRKDSFWRKHDQLNDNIVSMIITESFRKAEYERSEYFNQNSNSKIVTFGSFHYIQWEYPQEIVKIIKNIIQK
ncbi:hypothetical protein IMAU30143_01754 [Lactobacillus helveticus]|uniref:alpha/beta fold hydrolase n=1 Tax=Lactobacillus helveticus TaxID=1587 RepID=UPI001A0FECB3|nr:hypothetical protein [Lactobacillus helveticus]